MIVKRKLDVEKCAYITPVGATPDQKNMLMWVRLGDLPRDFLLDPNARRADLSTKVASEIMSTLKISPEAFWKLNSGIQMTARDVEVRDGRQVVLSLFDAEDDADEGVSDGVINGGHTYESIKKVFTDLEKTARQNDEAGMDAAERLERVKQAVVRVEVLTGIPRAELAEISRARNTGQAVKKFSLQNLKGLYKPIQDALGPVESSRIGFSENDLDQIPGTEYQVTDLIRLMTLFNNRLYPFDKDKHPSAVYTSAGRIIDRWEQDADTFAPLVRHLPDFMRLHDDVYELWCDLRASQKGPPRNGFEKRETTLPFTRRKVAWKISPAFVFPVVAGLRVLLTPNGEWQIDPFAFLQRNGKDLIAIHQQFYDEQTKAKPHELGRSVASWRAVASEARTRFLQESLQRLQSSL